MSGDDHFIMLDNDECALLPCPFCGGEAKRHDIESREDVDNAGASYIECEGCGACTQLHFDRKENLLDSWNRRARVGRLTDILNEIAARDRQNFPPHGGSIAAMAARGLRDYDPTTQPYDEPFRHVDRNWGSHVQNDQVTISLDHYTGLIRDHQKLTALECRPAPAQWRAFYNVSYPKLWGIETSDPAAHEAGLEIVVAPCMPEHAAKDIAAAWNERSHLIPAPVGGPGK